MKSSLWMIIALVTGIVGFLLGYSVSGFTGSRKAAADAAAHAAPAHDAGAGGYAGAGAPAHKTEAAGGYGGAAAPAHKAEAGGYGGAAQAAPAAHPEKVPADKPKAAGY